MKTRSIIIFFALSALLVLMEAGNSYSADTISHLQQKNDPIIAAQIHVLAGINWQEVAVEIDRLKEAGFNTIIFRSFQNRNDRFHSITGLGKDDSKVGVYFETVYAPTIVDIITPLSQLCQKKGMKLFAWMTTRTMDWLDIPYLKDTRFVPESGTLERSDKYDLFNVEFREYLFNITGDLASNDIDGIILQDDFAILTREGFSSSAMMRFGHKTKLSINPLSIFISERNTDEGNIISDPDSKLFRTWAVFKAEFLSETGEKLIEHLKNRNRNILVGINLYYDTVFYPDKAVRWLGQDLESIRKSSFDLVLMMAYHKQISEEVNISVIEAIEKLSSCNAELLQHFDKRLLIKLQLLDWKSGQALDNEELKQLSAVVPGGTCNIALAPVESGSDIFAIMSVIMKNIMLCGNGVR